MSSSNSMNGDNKATPTGIIITHNSNMPDVTYSDISQRTETDKGNLARASPEGESSTTKNTAEEVVAPAGPTNSVQGPKKMEAVTKVDHASESKDCCDPDESDQNNEYDQGYESGKTNYPDNVDQTDKSGEADLASPFSTPKQQTEDQELPISDDSKIENGTDLVIVKVEDSVPLAASELGTVQASENDQTRPSPPAVEVAKSVVARENGEAKPQDACVTPQEPPTPARPSASVPPHLRPDFLPVPRQNGLYNSRHMPPSELTRFHEVNRGPRFNPPVYESRRDTTDREQAARMNAQLMKLKADLDNERIKNVNMRGIFQDEYEKKFDAASSEILASFIREKYDAISAKASFEAKERELSYREEKIQQLEVYLSEGQKQLVHDIEKNGGETMSAIQARLIRREAVLSTKKNLADLEARASASIDRITVREKALKTREECCETLIRDALVAELKKSTISEDMAEEIAEVRYRNGFAAGKEAGRKEVPEKDNQRSFLEGYRVAHRTEVLLSKMRTGEIPADSPELGFLFDANHPYNPCTMGERLGRMEDDTVTTAIANSHTRNTAVVEKPATNGKTNGAVQHEPEEPVRRMPPPRLTFAAELRGPRPMHNGHFILANNAAANSSPANGSSGRPAAQVQEGESLIDLL